MTFFDAGNTHMYIAIVLSIINGIAMCFSAYKFFQIIQLSGYKIRGYFLWLRDTKARYVSRVVLLSVMSIFCSLVTNVLFDVYHGDSLFSYFGLIFYFYFTIVFINNMYAAPKKIPLKHTHRMTRLNVAMFIVSAGLSFVMIAVSFEFIKILKFGGLCLLPIFVPLLVPFVHLIMVPLESIIINGYLVRAKRKLKSFPNLIKIGITGSFGKTSTKYILNTILSQKYKVCMSPHSFNTLTGLAKVVNGYLVEENEVLITEMGARSPGDIKKLAKFVDPKYAIITGVGSQHLLSFNKIENIVKTKYELIESLPSDGFAVFNGDNKIAYEMYEKCPVKKAITGNTKKESEITFTRVRVDKKGTHFTLKIGEKSINCNTKLLGRHNVENIMLCVRMAQELGLTIEEIANGISNLKPVPHRLEMTENEDGTIILDDSYNASVEGCEVALEVLNKFGKNKIVVTPGLVELGRLEKEENFNFGVKMAKVANIIIIVNKVNLESIKEGVLSTGFDETKIYEAETLDVAKKLMKDILKPGDAVLFENDLPDNYI